MITTITGTGIIEAATVTPIMMTITGMKITIMIIRRRRRNPEGEAGNHNRWVAYWNCFPLLFFFFIFLIISFYNINAVVWLWHSVGICH